MLKCNKKLTDYFVPPADLAAASGLPAMDAARGAARNTTS